MSGRVLIVDDTTLNLILLQNKLEREYYTVFAVKSGEEAIRVIEEVKPDIILMDAVMQGMSGFNTVELIRSIPQMANVPIIITTALDSPEEKIQGLLSGADEFLNRPLDINLLLLKMRILLKLKKMSDALYAHFKALNKVEFLSWRNIKNLGDVKALILDNNKSDLNIEAVLRARGLASETSDQVEDLIKLAVENDKVSLIIINSLSVQDFLPSCSAIHNHEKTASLPILLILAAGTNTNKIAHTLDRGITDYIIEPIDANELYIRCQIHLRKYAYNSALQKEYMISLNSSNIDSLTKLSNRSYFEKYIQTITCYDDKFFILLDLDYFKSINDKYGHEAGDEVLKNFAQLILNNINITDSCARLGGDEFVIFLNSSNLANAYLTANKLLQCVAEQELEIFCYRQQIKKLHYTCSMGITKLLPSFSDTMRAADAALYKAKEHGRNTIAINNDGIIKVLGTKGSRKDLENSL